jgi:hypothetical protein
LLVLLDILFAVELVLFWDRREGRAGWQLGV